MCGERESYEIKLWGDEMIRFIMVIILCFFLILYYVPKMSYYGRHPEKYSEEECWAMLKIMITHIMKRGRISTITTGEEKLPRDEGYIMVSNHQGKWDALGIFINMEQPATYVMDAKRSRMLVANQLCELLHAKRLDKDDLRQQVQVINEVATEIQAGRRYLLFPEGGYDHNHNTLREFMPGSFKIALKAKCAIVPVVIYDSFKPFEGRSIRHVTTQVAFLDPIPFEELSGMNTYQIRDLVVSKIETKLVTMESLNDW